MTGSLLAMMEANFVLSESVTVGVVLVAVVAALSLPLLPPSSPSSSDDRVRISAQETSIYVVKTRINEHETYSC